MSRSEQVKVWVTEQTKAELVAEADRRDMSQSQLANQYIERGLRQDKEEEVSAETRAARQLQDIIDQGLDEFEQIAHDMKEMQARSGAHSVATFELIKDDYPETTIQDAFVTGRDRLREDTDPDDVAETRTDSTADSDDSDGGYWDE